jgi:NADH:ubiquinone oxidoreductase subunit 5 (subunit L)/multisubunit Na+/H+ antiporter MnhA subunit
MLPLWLIILLPLAGFVITGLFGAKMPKPMAGAIASLAVGAAFVVALLRVLGGVPGEGITETAYRWMQIGNFSVDAFARSPFRRDDSGGDGHRLSDSRLFHRLHGARS